MNPGTPTIPSASIPILWRETVLAFLEPGEEIVAWLETDLDQQMRYGRGLVLLTDRRLAASPSAPAAEGNSADPDWQTWPVADVADLTIREDGAVGTLELFGIASRLAFWRFTAAKATHAHRLAVRFNDLRRASQIEPDEDLQATGETVCPSCGAVLPADDPTCVACTPTVESHSTLSLLRLWRFARPLKGIVTLGFLLMVLSTATGLIAPYFSAPLIDEQLMPRQQVGRPIDWQVVNFYLAMMAGAAIVACLLGWAKTYILAWVSERIAADMRNETYAHLQTLSLEFFGGKRTGDLMSRIGNDTDRICIFLSVNLLEFGTDVLMLLFTAAILFWMNPWLALVTLLPLPLIAWLISAVRGRLLRGFQQGGRAMARVTSVLADTIPGVRVVKAFAQENREIERFRRANDHVLAANDRVNRIWSFFGPVVELLTALGLLVIWAGGAYLVGLDPEQLSVGTLVLFTGYIGRFYTRLESMSRMLAATQRAAASSQRVFEILDRVPSVPEPVMPIHPKHVRGEIELRHVGFQYGTRKIVDGVNLKIRPGEMIGLVGPSGAGKSTLVNLVCRFYDVTEGSIRVDGIDIRSYPVGEFREHIGLVLQEPFLFYGTIAENIAYGKPDATRQEIIAAARAARAHDFILRLPDGYDSLVGERGQSLSGGERQRISIARALLIDPRILILDEATSAVDTETELEIQEALDNLIQGRTTIAIAHRLSTLRKADRLVVMERGRIVEVGPHRELLQRPAGAYSRLHQAQLELAQA
ncbi:MAG TPA: ABC transporter ATP-binding protein [Pirellulales bacterium]|nr:ABC transporter ATP-binding protein [Pirellulales bacterium]